LQKTNGRITGPGACYLHPCIPACSHVPKGLPDDREPEYTRYFVKAPVSELTSTHAARDQLTVPAGSTTQLTVRIDFAGTVSIFHVLSNRLLKCCCTASQGTQSSRGSFFGGPVDGGSLLLFSSTNFLTRTDPEDHAW
jgi:hypothetical protein